MDIMPLPTRFDLTGKTAVITGGSGLLGVQHAHALMEVGADAVLADINIHTARAAAKKLNSIKLRGKAFPLLLDITKELDIYEALEKVTNSYGKINILVNNAAVNPKVNKESIIDSSRLENFSLEVC